jgi:hypothetical protein
MSRRLRRNPLNSGSDTFFGGNSLFLWFWVSAFNSLEVFYTIWQLFYLKTRLADASKQRRNIGDR